MNKQRLHRGQLVSRLSCLLLLAAFLAGCEKDVAEPEERIRAVKTIVVGDLASDQMRKFPGTVEPVESSQLSFEVDGIVQKVQVDVGDTFSKGDVLAHLDNQSFELSVASARAALARATAQLEERQSSYQRERRIQAEDPGATTQKAVDQARAGYESQVQEVTYSQARLELAERDLTNTELIAPYDGIVAARFIEPSEVAARGLHMLEVYAEAAMQVAVSIPEQVIGKVHTGLEGQVVLNNRPNEPYDATVAEVGSAATAANAFPVTAIINNPDEWVRPGMTAELKLAMADAEMQSAYLIPMQAFLPGIEEKEHYVYLFDNQSSTVRKTMVEIKGIQGNDVVIIGGIAPGDVLVVAGVPFLRDGQKVKLMPTSDSSQ